jgi:hypothetical protein
MLQNLLETVTPTVTPLPVPPETDPVTVVSHKTYDIIIAWRTNIINKPIDLNLFIFFKKFYFNNYKVF